ncbi:DUF334 domain-containing protein [Staphylococcus epidermidis]|nr:DUF334 domain-containing protein [Staphylococcus epidermidis]
MDDEHERHQEQQREPDYADGLRSTGMPSSNTQSNLNNEELNELKRQKH